MKKVGLSVFAVMIFLLAAEISHGQKKQQRIQRKKVIRYRKHTKINLDRALLEGILKDPNRVEITLSPERKLKSPLKPRTDFLKELRRDISQVR